MPLTNAQVAALTAISGARSPESYVAGSTPLNQRRGHWPSSPEIAAAMMERFTAT